MNKEQLDRIKKYFESKRNRERLLKSMKAGNYVEFIEKVGYIYAIKVGEMNGMNIMLRVSMLAGEFTIQEAFVQIAPGVEGVMFA